ncbi:amidase family protein [Paracoccus seriniphilus]|uniref:Aspartyl-tRNA(Asn)/glutamyl-tRNA(Gln) amidotransferase subunit A n=1 Tax=Paracoccus seriniphilus TaxID=184748 RepID=A0A239PUQ3_9RHOB|nr:amidase family protein [Paracoccus seriniphilus]WCR16549.1 amidase [Paracoccus seriniphilus]SNT73763.1 aspartyl-tRNA(Asn)/glutamyl-tRNA(Gln) amidotransferase subunit A [Paracoccus seriniphilus]
MTQDLLNQARAQATAPDFIQVFDDPITAEGPLSGLTVAVKDLFDVQGYATGAGTAPRTDRPLATRDAAAVARLRAAGAGLIGHANMTEYAYSGLGLNPHHGTPLTPLIEGCIAGGSTSGGASAVARGVADIALGTDTGGSARIPAAFCGIYGFKPTASTIPRDGAVPLSHSLDSVGVLTRDPALLRPTLNVLRDTPLPAADMPGTVIVPQNFGLDDVAPEIVEAFETALEVLAEGGISIRRLSLPFFDRYRALPVWQFSAVESRCHHGAEYDAHRDRLDPRVASRMARAEETDAPGYARTLLARQALADEATRIFADMPILLPSVAIMPPRLSDLEDDASYDRLNLLALRNTSLANVIDGCSVSLPLADLPGAGLMLTGPRGSDAMMLGMAEVLASEL